MILSTLTALWLIATGPAHVPVMDAPQFACITAAVYTEAEGEPYLGKLAVAAVVRARAERAQITPCAVVTARHQFSGLGRRIDTISLGALADSLGASIASGSDPAPVPNCAGATHFDNRSDATWTRRLTRVCQVGAHTFYREDP